MAQQKNNVNNGNSNNEEKVLRNYNGEPLKEGEILIHYFKNEADAENLTNPDSIRHRRIGSSNVTSVLTAFKAGTEAGLARKQFNSYINDLNGHFHSEKTVSSDALMEDYELEKGSADNDPAVFIELQQTGLEIINKLSEEAPQLMAAVIFHRAGIVGKDFEAAMKVSHDRAATINKTLSDLLPRMIHEGCEAVELKTRATAHDAYYKKIILEHMGEVLDALMNLF